MVSLFFRKYNEVPILKIEKHGNTYCKPSNLPSAVKSHGIFTIYPIYASEF